MNNIEKGNLGETIATRFLKSKGYIILDKNFRTKIGEIDIIASVDGNIHFVEVKLRKNREFGEAHQAVNRKKQSTIRRVASEYLKRFDGYYDEIIFDIIEIYTEEKLVNFIENAF